LRAPSFFLSLRAAEGCAAISAFPLPPFIKGDTGGFSWFAAGCFFFPITNSQLLPRSGLAAEPQEVLDNKYNSGYTFSMKTAISIPDKVFRSADALAKRLGVSRSELYATAVNEFLSKHRSRHVTARLDDVYSEEDSSMPSSLTQMQVRALPHEDW
jgi:hypothetical protein